MVQKILKGYNRWKDIIVFKPNDIEEDNRNKSSKKQGINLFIIVYKINNWFKAIDKTHARDHPIGKTL